MLLLQIIGVVLGLLYLYLEYKANIWLWLVGLIMPIVHGVLYYKSGLYADCAMNGYYVLAGLYGWIVWKNKKSDGKTVNIQKTPMKCAILLIPIYAILHVIIYWLLITFTNSTVPFADSFTTALSIIAMWMLAQKFVEQWLVWLVIDVVTVGLYIYKGIPITATLYALYSILAVVGYRKWLKEI